MQNKNLTGFLIFFVHCQINEIRPDAHALLRPFKEEYCCMLPFIKLPHVFLDTFFENVCD